MDYEKQIDEVIKGSAMKVQVDKITVLTGKNGSGKSMLRKLLSFILAEKLGTDPQHTVASVSMESRTQKKYEFSALSAMGIDDPTNPTSSETMHNINSLVNAHTEKNKRYLVIDEPEIGMGEEMVAALVLKLNKMFETMPEGVYGIMIITHNRYIVKHLNSEFINLEGMSREEWLNREIIPTDLAQFEEDSLGLYRAINNRLKK